jgi:hypothetical protein
MIDPEQYLKYGDTDLMNLTVLLVQSIQTPTGKQFIDDPEYFRKVIRLLRSLKQFEEFRIFWAMLTKAQRESLTTWCGLEVENKCGKYRFYPCVHYNIIRTDPAPILQVCSVPDVFHLHWLEFSTMQLWYLNNQPQVIQNNQHIIARYLTIEGCLHGLWDEAWTMIRIKQYEMLVAAL